MCSQLLIIIIKIFFSRFNTNRKWSITWRRKSKNWHPNWKTSLKLCTNSMKWYGWNYVSSQFYIYCLQLFTRSLLDLPEIFKFSLFALVQITENHVFWVLIEVVFITLFMMMCRSPNKTPSQHPMQKQVHAQRRDEHVETSSSSRRKSEPVISHVNGGTSGLGM